MAPQRLLQVSLGLSTPDYMCVVKELLHNNDLLLILMGHTFAALVDRLVQLLIHAESLLFTRKPMCYLLFF